MQSSAQSLKSQKLVSVLAISTLITDTKKKTLVLELISCIYYLVQFKKNTNKIQSINDSRSGINVIALAYTKKPGFQMQKINLRA